MVVRPATTRKLISKRPGLRVRLTRTVTDSVHIGVGEDLVLAPVDQLSGLVDISRGETVGVGLVVGELSVDVVVDIPLFGKSQSDNEFGRCGHGGKTYDVLQGGGTAEGVILKLGQKVLGLIGLRLELVRVLDLFDMLLESL